MNKLTQSARTIIEAKEKWVERLTKFGDSSSFSAVVYQFKSKSISKRLLWGLIIVAAIAGFCYITSKNIDDLVQNPISTSITESRERVLEFPAVTICSLSILNETKLNSLGMGNGFEFQETLETLLFFATLENKSDSVRRCTAIAQDIINSTGYDDGLSSLFNEFALENWLISCSFQGEDCLNDLVPIQTINGICYIFNGPKSGQPLKVQGTGVRQGLRLTLKNERQFFSLNQDYGYNVIVHDREEPPRPESEGIVVGLRSNLYIGMKQRTLIDNTQFYSRQDCIRESEHNATKLQYPDYYSYSLSLCLNDCLFTHIADECNCTERHVYEIANTSYAEKRFCGTLDICCEVMSFFHYKEDCHCPLKCKSVRRTLTASSATHSSEDRIGINVYYETLVTEVHETTDSYTPWSLISDIGGNTGLFLGFTLLTVGEVVLLVLALLTDCCCFISCKEKMKKCVPWCWATPKADDQINLTELKT